MEKVSVVSCDSYNSKKVRKALEESLQNINFKFKKNMTVLIKPNLLSPFRPEKAITTHPAILEEICKILGQHNATIYIGDSSAFDTDKALQICGINKLKKYAKIINFEGQEEKFFDFGEKMRKIPLPKLLFKVDLIINVAKMKTHGLTQVSLCVKNLYGCIPGQMKERIHGILTSQHDFSKFLVKLHDRIKPELNILDGVWGIEGEGPGASGKIVKSKIIITSKNACALDIIASRIMGFKPNRLYSNKLSKFKEKEIELVGSRKDIQLNFKKPNFSTIPFVMFIATLIPKPRISFNQKKCVKCGICRRKCPTGAIKLKPWPECNHEKCVRCLCCIEVCPNNAIYLKEHWIRAGLKAIAKKVIKF